MLDIPIHKTGTASTKPIDPVVGDAIVAWEKVRPPQPRADDIKTAESVDFLFSFRARRLPHAYLNSATHSDTLSQGRKHSTCGCAG